MRFRLVESLDELHVALTHRDRVSVQVESCGATTNYELKKTSHGIRLRRVCASGRHTEVLAWGQLAQSSIGYAIGRAKVTISQ